MNKEFSNCAACGEEIDKNMLYCPFCGAVQTLAENTRNESMEAGNGQEKVSVRKRIVYQVAEESKENESSAASEECITVREEKESQACMEEEWNANHDHYYDDTEVDEEPEDHVFRFQNKDMLKAALIIAATIIAAVIAML